MGKYGNNNVSNKGSKIEEEHESKGGDAEYKDEYMGERLDGSQEKEGVETFQGKIGEENVSKKR